MWLSISCGTEDLNISTEQVSDSTELHLLDDTTTAFYPPDNLDMVVNCKLEPSNNPEFNLNGKNRTYKSATEIDFKSIGWESRLSADWDFFNVGNLGVVGLNINNAKRTPSSIPENVRIAAIDIRNVNGVPHFFYMSNETAFAPIEQWSITKYLAVELALNNLRKKSNGNVGATATLNGREIADYITSIGRISDNPTAAWFKTLMGAENMTSQIQGSTIRSNWDFHLSKKTIPEIFLGKYGQDSASHGGKNPVFRSPGGKTYKVNRILDFPGSNTLSPLTLVEILKRFRLEATSAYPTVSSLTDQDKRKILYGSEKDEGYGGFLLGGTKTFAVEAFGGKEKLDKLTAGKWRIFGKTGSGFSRIRNRYEGAFIGSICLPKAPGGLKNSRQIIFLVNAQAITSDRRWQIRYETIKNMAKILIPELNLK